MQYSKTYQVQKKNKNMKNKVVLQTIFKVLTKTITQLCLFLKFIKSNVFSVYIMAQIANKRYILSCSAKLFNCVYALYHVVVVYKYLYTIFLIHSSGRFQQRTYYIPTRYTLSDLLFTYSYLKFACDLNLCISAKKKYDLIQVMEIYITIKTV